MVKCPFCGFGNEEGALFCEQCKSDISGVTPAAPPAAPPAVEEAPIMAAVVEEEVVAIAAPVAEVVDVVDVIAVEEPPAAPPPAAVAAPEPPAAPPAPAAVPVPPPAAPAAAPAAPAPAAAKPTPIPAGSEPKLEVTRGLKVKDIFNLFPGENFIGRNDEKPVDIDLTFQEPEDKVWVSRQHAMISWDDATGTLTIEDLNSANGTYVNRVKIYPGQPQALSVGSTIQIGTVHMRVKV